LKHLDSPGKPERDEISEWLKKFSTYVREQDFGSASALFDPGVLGFGSIAGRCDGISALRREQWERTWPMTSKFDVHDHNIRIEIAGDLAWIATTWSSLGHLPDRAPFERAGRATLILRRAPSGDWQAVHSHFSLMPGLPGP